MSSPLALTVLAGSLGLCLALTACAMRQPPPPLRTRVAAGVERVHAVILEISRGPGFQLEEEYCDDHRSLVRGRLAGSRGQPVTIRTLRVTPSLSTIDLRPGPFGDRQRTRDLLSTIRARLDAPAPEGRAPHGPPTPPPLEELR